MRKSASYRSKQEKITAAVRSAFAGVGVLFLCVLLFSFVISKIDVSDGIVRLLASLSLCAACFSSSYVCARQRGRDGLVSGLFVGGITFGVIFILSMFIYGGISGSGGFFSKLLMILSCSAIGGIIGVNAKTLKKP